MNKSQKDNLRPFVAFLENTWKSILSLVYICAFSKVKVARESRKHYKLKANESCTILGNGPSLKSALANNEVLLDGCDLMCVNMFCQSEYFQILKPRFYFLGDPVYFYPRNERHEQLIETLIEAFKHVDWEMYLELGQNKTKGSKLIDTLDNPNIHIVRENGTTVDGFKWFRHWMYRKGMGMPRGQNILNGVVCTAINMKYKNVYLYGADHTWTRDLFVDENNVTCYGDRHLYNTNVSVIKHELDFGSLLIAFGKMFLSHKQCAEYAKASGVQIYNCTKDTFIDAYERKK